MRTATKRLGVTIAVVLGCAPSPAATIPALAEPNAATVPALGEDPPFDPAAAWDELERLMREAYAYLDRDDFDVEAQLRHARAQAIATDSPEAFRRVVHRSTFAFTDPHFIIGPFADDDPNIYPTSSDLVLTHEGEAWVVADVRRESAAADAGVRPGWHLVGVDGRTPADAIAAVWEGAVLARTPRQQAYAITLAANGRREGTRILDFDLGGARRSVTLANPRELARDVDARPVLTVTRAGDVPVLRPENSLGKYDLIAAFDEAIAEIGDAPGLVLDLRNTPSGGNTDVARAIIGHFVTTTRAYQVHEIPGVERATTVPRRFVEQVLPRAPTFSGKVAVLGGHWTGSMGEGLVIGMHAAAGAKTFASDMGDLLGGLYNFDLKHAPARVDLGAERLLHVDGTPREAFVADVALPSADLAADGSDPALAAALAWLRTPSK